MSDPVQRLLAGLLSLLTLPLVAVLALAVRLDSPGPSLYRSERIGQGGRPFACIKLRTMRWDPVGGGPAVTARTDVRLTRVGRALRRFRLDELPQLWNVARGEMRLVGPRPESPRFVDLGDPVHREVFTVRPGITGLAQLLYVDEADLLDEADPDHHYRDEILPAKLRLDLAYLHHRSTRLDLWILAQTPIALMGRAIVPPAAIRADLARA
ncbi:MAG: sugar transferase [Chloroflexi bacterium]|nr:sugar transferase [Chloroflexota bacterium]